MERTKSKKYIIDGIPVEEYQCKGVNDDKWFLVLKYFDGITDESLKLFDKVKQRYGKFMYAEVERRDESSQKYLMLKDEHGNELHLSGCTSGYGGTGPRGTLDLLNKLGFNVDKRFIFCARTFAIYHPDTGL